MGPWERLVGWTWRAVRRVVWIDSDVRESEAVPKLNRRVLLVLGDDDEEAE